MCKNPSSITVLRNKKYGEGGKRTGRKGKNFKLYIIAHNFNQQEAEAEAGKSPKVQTSQGDLVRPISKKKKRKGEEERKEIQVSFNSFFFFLKKTKPPISLLQVRDTQPGGT